MINATMNLVNETVLLEVAMRISSFCLAIIILVAANACTPAIPITQVSGDDQASQSNDSATAVGNVAQSEQPSSAESTVNGSVNPDCPSLPSDLPVTEDADQMGEYQGWCSYSTQLGYQAIVDLYNDYLSSSGWQKFRKVEDSESDTVMTHFYYQRDDQKIAIGVLGINSSQKVIITIYPGHWIDQACDLGDSGIPTPDDIPIIGNMIGYCAEEYPWNEEGWTAYTYQFTTLEDFNTTLEYYRLELPNRGWTYDQELTSGDIIELDFLKPGRTGTVQSSLNNYIEGTLDHLSVTLIPIKEYGDTLVKIVVTAQ